jgi:gluconate 5-dehydrogenase
MFEMFSLQGREAFISGASRGLGHEMAMTLAEAGADVALAARTLKALEKTAETIRDNSSKDVTLIAIFEEADFLGG